MNTSPAFILQFLAFAFQLFDNALQPLFSVARDLSQRRIVNDAEHHFRVDDGNERAPIFFLRNNDVAWQQHANFGSSTQRTVR